VYHYTKGTVQRKALHCRYFTSIFTTSVTGLLLLNFGPSAHLTKHWDWKDC